MSNDNDPMTGEQPQPDGQQPEETAEATGPSPVTRQRKTLWMVGIGIGVYMIGRGIWQAITGQP